MIFEFFKITSPIVFNQRFEPGTLGSESQCSSTGPSWDLYVRSGDNVVNAKGRANEISQSWCPADLFDFQLPTTGTSQRPMFAMIGNRDLCTKCHVAPLEKKHMELNISL